MGQYYKFMNLDKKQKCNRNRHSYKLMEHSYLCNDYCDDILRLLSKEWKGDRVIHVGDYACPNDETNTELKIKDFLDEFNIDPNENSLYNFSESFEEVKSKSKQDIRYVYNLDRIEYIDLYKQPIQWCYLDDNYFGPVKINSFALLIGCGNGLGGGDYHGINEELVGDWAGDRFVASADLLKEYDYFKCKDCIFSEVKDYENIVNFNEEDILDKEMDLVNREIESFQKWGKNINGIKFDSQGLLDKERKVLESIFTISQDCKKNKEDEICI